MQHEMSERAQAVETLSQAIAERRLVSTCYNGTEMELAPHQIFLRHDALFVGAFNPGKNWRSPEEHRLSYFNLSGLNGVKLRDRGFRPLEEYDGALPRPEDRPLFALETS